MNRGNPPNRSFGGASASRRPDEAALRNPAKVLLDSSDEEETPKPSAAWKVNADYAKKYDDWRAKEEMQKLKDKYGDNPDEDGSSSTSESEDEDAEALTPEIEKDFFRTLSVLKNKDPRMYDKSQKFFRDQPDERPDGSEKKAKVKPMFLKDYERKVLLQEGGVVDESKIKMPPKFQSEYDKEQEDIKRKFSALVDEEDEDDTLLVKREKTEVERAKEDEDYMAWLRGAGGTIKDETTQASLKPLKDFWSDKSLDDGEKFLRDYILDRKYIDKDTERIPSYREIVQENFSEEEDELEKADEFEHKYNFRFEEPDPDFIKRFPRTMDDSLRRKDDSRKKKRDEIKERKEEEKNRAREDIKQLKSLKRRELAQKIEKLRAVAGTEAFAVEDDDLEGDFDPEKYDRLMHKEFGDSYYGTQEELEKPELSDESDIDENWLAEQEEETKDIVRQKDLDVDQGDDGAGPSTSRDANDPQKAKRKRRTKVSEAVQNPKPAFDPKEKKLEEYLDEYYKLDFEDIVGGVPCRFKYRTVAANNFGLSEEEILVAQDRELNAWCSLKKTVQYRSPEEEMCDLRTYKQKGSLRDIKLKIIPSLADMESKPESETEQPAAKKRRRRKAKNKGHEDAPVQLQSVQLGTENGSSSSKAEVPPMAAGLNTSDTTISEPLPAQEISTQSKKKKRSKKDMAVPDKTLVPMEYVVAKDESVEDNMSNGEGTSGNPRRKRKTTESADTSSKDLPTGAEVDMLKPLTLDSGAQAKKRRKRKKNKKTADTGASQDEQPTKKLKSSHDHQEFLKNLPSAKISDDRLKAYGLNPKRFRQKEKYVLLAKSKQK